MPVGRDLRMPLTFKRPRKPRKERCGHHEAGLPPDASVLPEILTGSAETLRIAVIGTLGAVVLGPLPGIIAVALHATGMLAKFFAEAIDGVACDTIFRFKLNLRESLIPGIVGAGRIGFYIQSYVRSFQYDKAASVTLAVIAMVIAIETVNTALRRRLS